jgi:hypothetical protein
VTNAEVTDAVLDIAAGWMGKCIDEERIPYLLVALPFDGKPLEALLCRREDATTEQVICVMEDVLRLLRERIGAQ